MCTNKTGNKQIDKMAVIKPRFIIAPKCDLLGVKTVTVDIINRSTKILSDIQERVDSLESMGLWKRTISWSDRDYHLQT